MFPDDPNTDAVSLGIPRDVETGEVSLPTINDGAQPLSRPVAEQRAAKTEFAGVDPARTRPDFFQDYMAGREQQLRSDAAHRQDVLFAQKRQKDVLDLVQQKGGAVTPSEINRLMNQYREVDPRDVIERAYADKYISSLNTARGYLRDNLLDSSKSALGELYTQTTLDAGSELLARNQYLYTKLQNAQELVDKQSWGGYLADFAKGLFQPYNEIKLRGLIGSSLSAFGLGTVLDNQHSELYDMPSDKFKNTIDAVMEHLSKDNPQLAVYWAKTMLGQADWESKLQNIFTAMMPADYGGLVKGAGKLVRNSLRERMVSKAAADMVEAATKDPSFSPKTVAEGAGDLHEAAVQRVSEGMNPMEKAEHDLLSTWWSDAKKLVSNPGTYLSREANTRLQADVDVGTSLFDSLRNISRPERALESVNSPEVNRVRIERLRQDYKGPQNTILDIEGPFIEEASRTNWFVRKIGNYDASLFPNIETAKGFARQLGLADPVIKGSEADRVFLSPTAVKNIESIKTTEKGTKFFTDGDIEIVPSTRPEAGLIPYNLKTNKFEAELTPETAVNQQGLGFYIEDWIPLKENDDLTRDTLKRTLGNQEINQAASGGKGLVNQVLGWVRNSDETMSFNESAQRKAVAYSQNNLNKWMQGVARDLVDIRNGRVRYDELTGEELPAWRVWATSYLGGKIKGRQINEEFTRTLNHARETQKFFEDATQLQDFYQRTFKRDPSFLETKAYFGFVKAVEGDRMMMEIAEFRNRAVLGAEQVQISYLDPKTGQKISSGFFDGIPLKSYPGTADEFILHVGANKGDEVLYELGKTDSKRVKAMSDKVAKGEARVYQIYDHMHTPLKDFSEVAGGKNPKIISYVYIDGGNVETKSLNFNHVVRRGGGHFEWDYDHYLKIADIRPQYTTGLNNKISFKNIYAGDTTIMPVSSRAHGENLAKIWNEIHGLIKEGKWEDAKPLIAKIGIKFDQFSGWYKEGAEGKAFLDFNQKVHVVPRNKQILDLSDELIKQYRVPNKTDPTKYTDTLVDYTKRGPSNNFKVQYNQERNSSFDMKTINDVGTQGNPIYQYQPANMVDPLETMNRALRRMVNTTFMDDYKRYHVEHWLRDAEPYLKYDSINEVRSNPFGWYEKPEWRAGVEKHIINNLMANQMKGKMFIGTPSKFDTWVHSATNQLVDSFYTKYGPEENRGMLRKAATIAPIWALQHLEDPASFLRSVAFNFKLGLFAVPQFLVQAQTHSVILALEPRAGTMGTYGMLLHGWGSFTKNPRILESLDEAATKINMFGSKWRKGEWLEARKELDKSGFGNVAGEYANLDNQLKQKAVMNDWEKGLQLGQAPFRLGEQSTRITAWYTVFRKFRDENPTAAITNTVRNELLQQADLLTVNMSRASNSALSHGAFSLSTQFLSYQIKLAELFWGKRLGETLTERNLARARLLTFGAALYGVPNAIGITGLPFSDNIKEHFMDSLGYIPGEKWLSTMTNEGLPAWTMAMITGKLPNVGDRFGSQGFTNIKQALRGDIPWWQVVGGASTSVVSNTFMAGLDPYYQYALSWYRGDSPDERFRIKAADLVEPMKEISSYSMVAKWITAIESGKWISKNEQAVSDVTPWQATLLALTGMNPQEQDDMFINNKMIQGEKETKKKVLKEVIKDWRRGMEAMDNNDPEQAHAYKRNALARMRATGYTPEEVLKALAISSRTGNAVDTSNYQRFMQGDFGKRDERREYYRRQLQMKENQ